MVDAIASLVSILQSNWNKPPQPSIEDIANLDKGDAKRVRMLDKDVIRIFETAHNEAQPELLYDFVNQHVNLTIDIRSVQTRARLSELRDETRRILHAFRKGDGINFDRIIFKTRTDLSDRSKKLFRYTLQCEVVTFTLDATGDGGAVVNPATGAVTVGQAQAFDTDLTALAALTHSDGAFIVSDGTTWVAESGATARTSLGLGSLATKSTIDTTDITGSAILTSSESFADSDTAIMTAAAIEDKILSYGYTTETGDITGVAAGTGLSGGGTSGDVTLNVDTNTIATKSYVDTSVSNLVDGAPGVLDTLNELAAAIGDDASFTTTITTSIGTKLAKASNLSDLASASTARTNLGLGAFATQSLANGGDNRIITSTASSTLNAEATLTYDGAKLQIDNGAGEVIGIGGGGTGYQSIEIGGDTGAFIDLKSPASDDFDLRIISTGSGGTIQTSSPLTLQTGSDNSDITLTPHGTGNVQVNADIVITGGVSVSGGYGLAASDIPSLATSKITSGTFADARIAASNVTQHQAALSITESQISDLQSYLTAPRSVTAGGNTLANGETLAFTAGTGITISETGGAVTITNSVTDTNTFRTVTAGGNTLGASETLAFTAGSNVTITETGGAVTIASTDTNTQLTLLDQDDMSSNSATAAASQQSIKTFVNNKVADLVDSAPGTLDTLGELATALQANDSDITTITTALGNRLRVDVNDQSLSATYQSNALTNLGITASLAEINILDDGLSASDIPNLDASKITSGTLGTARIPSLATSKITSGTFANGRISEGSVTQHQAALSITESQISDLGSYITAVRSVTAGGNTLAGNETLAFTAGSNVTISESNGAVTIASTDTNTNQLTTFTLAGDSGSSQTIGQGNTLKIGGGGGIDTVAEDTDTITVSHSDTSSQASVNNSGRTYVQDITLDTYGHITGITSATESVTNTDVDVNVSNLTARLPQITESLTIGDATDVTVTTSGDLVVTGDLTVSGDTVTVNTATLSVEDPLIFLANGQSGSPSVDIGFIGERGSSSNVGIIWDESADTFSAINTSDTATTAGNVTIASYANFKANAFTGSLTGNASTASALASAVNIAGQSFDGSSSITIASTDLSDITALDTDLSTVSGSDNTLASAKAIKSYVDTQIASSGDITQVIAGSGLTGGATSGAATLALDIAGISTALSSGLASDDEFAVSDAGTVKRMDVSVLQSYLQSNLTFTNLSTENVQDIAGPLVATGGTKTRITIDYDDTNNNMDFVVDDMNFSVSDITGATALESGLASTDELVLSDDGTLKRMDISVLESYMQSNLNFTSDTNTQNVFASSFVDDTDDIILRLTKSGASSGTQDVTMVAGSGITLTHDSSSQMTIASTTTANDATITLTAGTGLSGGGDLTTNQSGNETITFNVSGLTVSEIAGTSILIGDETFADNDNNLMTAAAVNDRIEAIALLDSELTDLAGVKGVTISTLQVKPSEGAFANGDKTKLDGIEASADVTDTANVRTALNAAMPSNTLTIGDGSTAVTIPGDLTVTGDTTYSNETIQIVTDNTLAFRAGDGNLHEILLTATDATSDKTITLPDATGTVALTSQLSDTQNVFTSSFVDSSDDILLRLTKSGASSGTQDIKFVAGTNVTLAHTDANNITISSTDTNTVYTHPNHTGEVTSTADGATVIASNVVDEDNLKATNSPTDNYLLSYDDATGGFTWVAAGAGGENNQNAFSTISVSGQDDVVADIATDTLTFAAGSNITLTTNASSDTVTIAATDTNTQLSTEQVQDIVGAMFSSNTETNITATYQDGDGTIDLVANAGDITSVVAGTGLSGGATSGDATLNVSGLTVTEFSAAAIQLSNESFSDSDAVLMTAAAVNDRIESFGYTTNVGDITGVTAGTGLSGGGNSGALTVSLDDPINLGQLNESTDATDDKILLWDESASSWKYMTLDDLQDSIDTSTSVSDFMTNGSNNRILTATGTDAMNAEANLTFDGSTLALTGDMTASSAIQGSQFRLYSASNRIGLPATNEIGIFTNGNERVRIDEVGRVGLGNTNPSSRLHINNSVTNPAADANDSFAVFVNADLSGSSATGGDREQGAIYVDVDSSTTGGDTSDEHRAYGVWADVRLNDAADSDLLYGIYGYVEGQRSTGSTTGTTSVARAGYFFAGSDETSDYTIGELTGVYGYASLQDSGTVSASYGVRGLANVYHTRTENLGGVHGGFFEIDISDERTNGDDITLGDSEVVHAVFDHNCAASGEGKVAITNAFLFKGLHAITDSSQVTTAHGVYIENEDSNYFSGKVGIGTDTPAVNLHVSHATDPKIRVQDTTANYSSTLAGYSGGAYLAMGDMDSSESSFLLLGAFNSINNLNTKSRDFHLYGTNTTTGLYFDESAGRFGIGTTSPDAHLHVEGSGIQYIRVESTDNQAGIQLLSDSADSWIMYSPNGSDDLRFFTDTGTDADVMTLEGTNKRVGIGTTSPDRLLEITEQGTGAAYLRLSSTNTSYPSDTIFGGIEFYNADSSGAGVGATIDALSNGSGRGGYLQFRTDPDGSGSPSVRMTIDENGNVGIGTTSPGGELHVAGSIIVDYAIAHGGDTNNQIVFTTDTQSFNTDGTTRMTIASDGAVSVAGAFSAATKSFDIEHPTKEGMRLHHGSLEGPEHGVYIRGRLEGNEIDLPDYWLGLVDEDTITVQLTPNRGFQQIYVQDISDNKVHVASHDGKPIDCFYLIQGERKDIERFEVEY